MQRLQNIRNTLLSSENNQEQERSKFPINGCALLSYLLIIALFLDNTDYETPLRAWLIAFFVMKTIDIILNIIRFFSGNRAKKILTIISLILIVIYIVLIIIGFVWYSQESERGAIKVIVIILCSISIILYGIIFICIAILIVVLCFVSGGSLNPANIETIEKYTNIYIYSDFFKSDKDRFNDTECAICKEDYIKDDKIMKLNCDHYLHKKCLSEWLKINKTCPYCRSPIDVEV